MLIKINVDLSNYRNQTLRVRLDYETGAARNGAALPALAVKNGVEIADLSVLDDAGRAVPFTVEGETLLIEAAAFRLSYALQTGYTQCVGSDKDVDFLYPFLNANEIFFGSGAIAYPTPLPDLAETMQVSFHLTNLPAGWRVFSNLTAAEISPAALDGFFVYCAPAQPVERYTFKGVDRSIDFRLCVQYGKSIPLAPQEIWQYVETYCQWLERHLRPLSHLQTVNILILQAPAEFEAVANGRSFATGENVWNGIAAYAPTDGAYLRRMFNYSAYAYFLYDGLTHELMHYYTTTAWQGKYKSILYPAPDCPPQAARLLGETLNFYFHDRYLRRYVSGSDAQFITETLARARLSQEQTGRPNPLLGLFVVDLYLRSRGSSLLELFGRMLARQQATGEPYRSMAILFEVLEEEFGLTLPVEYREILLGTRMADPAMVEAALRRRDLG